MTQYLSAEALGITETERAAMIATIDVLKGEQIIFDMGTPCSIGYEPSWDVSSVPTAACGTSCCIGGTMSLLMQNDMKLPEIVTPEMGDIATAYVTSHEDETKHLYQLFYGDTLEEDPKAGIQAIERFLSGNTRNPWLIYADD